MRRRSAQAQVLWVPSPYRAGFCITDDTDDATLAGVRAVYDTLHHFGLKATKTVWAFEPEEPCGIPATPPSTLRGVTLEDPDYLAYCRTLAERGFEIALHGASAGNNRRGRTAAAFEVLERTFGNSGTYICHSKNADNIYWEDKVAPNAALRRLLGLYSRHRCFGEVQDSPYFWGDVCRERVRWIRLFRTRNTNTLAADPAMPYFEPHKPYVRGWFSATKRSFHDCTTPAALDRLVDEHGLTVLYQYMHRYALSDGSGVAPSFRAAAERLAADERILVDTTARLMGRLQQMHGVVVVVRGDEAWLGNTNAVAVEDIQILLPRSVRCTAPASRAERDGRYLCIAHLAAGELLHLPFDRSIRFKGPRVLRVGTDGRGSIRLGLATALANTSAEAWTEKGITVPSGAIRLVPDAGYKESPPLSVPSQAVRTRLFFGQLAIIAREIALRKRSVDPDAFLGADTILLEDHDNW